MTVPRPAERPVPRPVTALKTVALYFTLLAAPLAAAQDLSSDEILENVRATAEAVTDVRFVLTGELQERDGSGIELELNVEAIPELQLVRAEFVLPDALADNLVILDGDTVYNYLFLTNQVTILDASDPDALGDLFETRAQEGELGFDFSLDLNVLFAGWEVEVIGFEPTPAGDAYRLRFVNYDLSAEVSHVEAQVLDGEWTPYRVTLFDVDGMVVASLGFRDIVRDPGLTPAALRALPADAEVFDER